MTRIFTTGAEEADPNALWSIVDFYSTHHGGQLSFGANDKITIPPRTGRGVYQLLNQDRLTFDNTITYTELYFGFAINCRTLGISQILYAWTDDPGVYSNFLSIRLASTGAVEVKRTATTIATSAEGVITIGQWYYFEVWFKPLNSNGRAVVKVDGSTVIDFTGDTTNEEEFINAFSFGGNSGDNAGYGGMLLDDIVVNSADGAVNNTYPGMVRLLPIRPDSTGTNSDWTRAGVDLGSDEAQLRNGTWEFAMMQTPDADDLQDAVPEIPDLPAGATITNIVLSVRAKVEAGAGVIAPLVIANGTSDISADQTLVSAWRYYQYAWDVNPDDSAAWDEADLSLLKIGVSS